MLRRSRRRAAAALVLLLACLQITSPHSPSDWSDSGVSALPACGMYLLSHGRARPSGDTRGVGALALTCDPGYVLGGPGDAAVRCKPDGGFTEGKTCRPISCGPLAEPGSIADPPGEILYPNAAKLTCGRGYRLSQGRVAERRCLSSGKFSDGASCHPAETWNSINVQHARSDRLADLRLLVDGQGFIAGAYYECHLTRGGVAETCTRISSQVSYFAV